MTTQTAVELDDIEGLEEDQVASWGDYPLDAMMIRNENRTVYDVLRRIDAGRFIMDPEFQRDFIWPEQKQSKLIESVVMRIPLPVFYLAEDAEGRMIVVDGLQRLSTFHRFVNNKHRLQLPDRPELHGKRFHDLTNQLQNRIEDCNLTLYIIDSNAPDQAKLDIFDRVNSGETLVRQQMRNCLYMGPATRFLKAEAQTAIFRRATGRSLRPTKMRDREFVNRFCAFQVLDLDEYRDMDEFLARSLRKLNRDADSLPALAEQFRTTLANNFELFGKHAFRKHAPDDEYRSVLNASLWDVMSTGLSHYSPQHVEERADTLRDAFYRLLDDYDFQYSITYATNSVKQVRCRFGKAMAMFEDVLGAYSA